jgi:hypothetical protein
LRFPEFKLLLISPCTQFWFVSVIAKYLNFVTLSKDMYLYVVILPCIQFMN